MCGHFSDHSNFIINITKFSAHVEWVWVNKNKIRDCKENLIRKSNSKGYVLSRDLKRTLRGAGRTSHFIISRFENQSTCLQIKPRFFGWIVWFLSRLGQFTTLKGINSIQPLHQRNASITACLVLKVLSALQAAQKLWRLFVFFPTQ